MAENRQLFSAQALLPSLPPASPKGDVTCTESVSRPSSVSAYVAAACCAAAQLPRIHDKAWFFHTALLPLLQTSTVRRDGSQPQHRSGQAHEEADPLLARKDVGPVGSPKSEEQASSCSPIGPAPTFCMESNHLFFKDDLSLSGTGASLADRYSLRTLYTSRCLSLGMRRPCEHLLLQLPSEADRDTAHQLRTIVARDTYVPAKACQALTVLLPYCTELEYIDFCHAGLRSRCGFMTGVNALLDALICSVGDKGIGAALHTLDLSFNELNDRTGWRLVRLIQRRPRLRVVNTDGTEISGKVKTRIAEELHKNSTACTSSMFGSEANAEPTIAATVTQLLDVADPLEKRNAASVLPDDLADGLEGKLTVVCDGDGILCRATARARERHSARSSDSRESGERKATGGQSTSARNSGAAATDGSKGSEAEQLQRPVPSNGAAALDSTDPSPLEV
ncbi:hypothetical protein JIQ42_03100 [Leishmania sp. Namibia]|uniref:hypothetical protein n=1 Tax=Leishmania sp. Namibia TaxID=2802991 RepID=UPI001B5DFA1F|nr:hypothetical protein JIQ42_03100 [Leishmania sp. Namibia]